MLRRARDTLAYADDMVMLHHARALTAADALVLLTVKDGDGYRLDVKGKLGRAIEEALGRVQFDSGVDSVVTIPAPTWSDYRTVVVVGVDGTTSRISALRYAAGTAVRGLSGSAVIAFAPRTEAESTAVLEGALLAATRTISRKSGEAPAALTELTIVARHAPVETRVVAKVAAVSFVRDVVTEAPNLLGPDDLAQRVAEASRDAHLAVDVLDEKALAQGGFGGILGIGAGSARPPRLVTVRYAPNGATKHIALVGKGITFDTGGLSIKPAAGMVGMKYDMTGAATVFAVTRAIAALELPIRVTAWLCIAENMPSGTAIRPNDVVTIRGGKTVEVTNTDAEGRVVLADGLVAASEELPDAIIDVATLTGAARVALGDRIAGIMGDSTLTRRIADAAQVAGEEVWAMPLPAYLKPVLSSDIADIANAKIGHSVAGMLIGGTFLREFVGADESGTPIPWAHLDIAGPANNGGAPYGVVPKGATGTMVRTLIATIEQLAASNRALGKKE
jgi:leucyl aminopeptidase